MISLSQALSLKLSPHHDFSPSSSLSLLAHGVGSFSTIADRLSLHQSLFWPAELLRSLWAWWRHKLSGFYSTLHISGMISISHSLWLVIQFCSVLKMKRFNSGDSNEAGSDGSETWWCIFFFFFFKCMIAMGISKCTKASWLGRHLYSTIFLLSHSIKIKLKTKLKFRCLQERLKQKRKMHTCIEKTSTCRQAK